MNTYYTTGYPRLRRGRSCDLCGDWMMRGEHHTTWTWFASDKPWRGHAHILCTKTAHPRGGHDGWAEIMATHAPAAWVDAWADGTFHPAALHAWLHGLEIPT